MDPEIKTLLEKSIALGEENNRILRGLRRSNRLSMIWKIVYLGIFLGGAAIAYNFIIPYLEQAQSAYGSLIDTQTQVNESVGGFKDFFKTSE